MARYVRYLGVVVPAGIVGVSLLLAATTPSLVSAQSPSLAATTPSQLLGDVLGASPQPLVGTVAENASLLPSGLTLGSTPLSSISPFLSGSQTFSIWRGSSNEYRIQYTSATSEIDYYDNSTQAWLWNSTTQTATQLSVPSATTTTSYQDPQLLADQIISNLSTYSNVTLGANTFVGGVPAYDLKIVPTQDQSTITRVDIFVDSHYDQVLGVSLYTQGQSTPTFSLQYQTISFTSPSASTFNFTPPSTATVKTLSSTTSSTSTMSTTFSSLSSQAQKIGSGWEVVHVLPKGSYQDLINSVPSAYSSEVSMITAIETPVAAPQGASEAISTPMVNVLILPDGRVLYGTVQQAVLLSDASLLGD